MIFSLERIHKTENTSFYLSELYRSYTCGRSKENDIICPNILVSRRHCIFLRDNENLYVTDLRSTNGVHINGEKKESVQIRLRNNDVIGIGCSSINPKNDETFYVYRVRIFESPITEGDEIDVISDTNINSLQEIPSVSSENDVLKRKIKHCEVVNKRLKVGCDNKQNCNDNSSKGNVSDLSNNNQKSHNNNSTSNLVEAECIIDDDIEIIHTSLAKDVKKETVANNNSNSNANCNPELQTDDEEDVNIEHMEYNTSKDISLIKLKKIKHEPKVQFSDIDVVDLSDDEDGIFPYSQLFDIKYEDDADTKIEIKQECVNNDELSTENITLINVDDEVIILTDSEDENNPWLDRLSRSQLLNDDSKSVFTDTVANDENDLGIWDEISNMVDPSEIPSTSEVSCNKEIVQSHASAYDKVRNKKDDYNTNLQQTEINVLNMNEVGFSNELSLKDSDRNKQIINSNINTSSSIKEVTRMDVDEANSFHESSAKDIDKSKQDADINICDKSKQKTEKKQTAKKDDQTLENLKQKLIAKSTKKLIPVIEPLELPLRRRQINHSKNKEIKVRETSQSKLALKEKTSKNDHNLSKIKKHVNDHFYDKEQTLQKNCRKRSKSISGGFSLSEILPKPGSSISKDEKKKIIENRKMKLKKIAETAAEEKKARENGQNINRRIAKPRAKISLKNRGDFLITEHESQESKSISNQSTKPSTSNTNQADVENFMISCKKTLKLHEKTNVSKDSVNTIATSLQQTLHLNNVPSTSEEKKTSCKTIDDKKRHNDANNSNMNIASTSKSSLQNMSIERDSVVNKKYLSSDNLKSILVKVKNKSLKKKKVSFSDKLEVNDYEIDSSNTLKKLHGKDAPIPTDKLVWTPVVYTDWSPKLEEFLARIFMWNPVWLEEQRYLKRDPPIVSECELQPMRLSYDSFKQYYKIAMPLLLLEIWCIITKDFETKNMQRATMMCAIVENSITYTPISSNNLFLMTLTLQVLVNKEDLSKQIHPVFGDLVYLEYASNVRGKKNFYKIFGYITQMHHTIINEFTHYNRELRSYVKDPYTVITYTLLTRNVEHVIPVNRLHRVRTVTYLRPNIRMVQALQYLPQSPLLKMIVNPKIENYQLPPLNEQNVSSLVTKDNLNSKQLEAVFRVTDTVLKKDPKLCFIQGPPGTGKTKVIVNLVTQILYGERENKTSLKILICAPSNAAVDEIVLRLLDIRSTLKQKRFNMVRIGRLETMHLSVKNISVTELAKKYLLKITKKPELNSISYAEELATLQTCIDSLRNQLANMKHRDETKRSSLSNCLFEASTRYELLRSNKTINDLHPKEYVKYQRGSEKIIISNANIIACTLSSCYTNQMESFFGHKERISVCIVDEATQSCEAETLIPLMLGVNTMVLVGDPNQLPATIISQRAKKLGLDQSVFSRIQNVFASHPNSPIIMLDTQYRMDYAISYWPNKHFYKGRLKNAVESFSTFPFYPYRVLHHGFVQNDDKFSNTTEAEFIANIILTMLLFANWEQTSTTVSLGILTPYQNQRTLIMNKINEKISSVPYNVKKKIDFEVNTVDSFQGQERDIIIMSCVRSKGIGFLSDKQRLCVALTRAKRSLILCGNFDTFMKDQMWKALLIDAKTRGILYHIKPNATPTAIKQFIIK
ncbi:hypothetical protein PUN28_016311 [Cardiocondyla obscurior]